MLITHLVTKRSVQETFVFSIKATCGAIRGKLLVECLVQVIEESPEE